MPRCLQDRSEMRCKNVSRQLIPPRIEFSLSRARLQSRSGQSANEDNRGRRGELVLTYGANSGFSPQTRVQLRIQAARCERQTRRQRENATDETEAECTSARIRGRDKVDGQAATMTRVASRLQREGGASFYPLLFCTRALHVRDWKEQHVRRFAIKFLYCRSPRIIPAYFVCVFQTTERRETFLVHRVYNKYMSKKSFSTWKMHLFQGGMLFGKKSIIELKIKNTQIVCDFNTVEIRTILSVITK